jgi:hypothetical protein
MPRKESTHLPQQGCCAEHPDPDPDVTVVKPSAGQEQTRPSKPAPAGGGRSTQAAWAVHGAVCRGVAKNDAGEIGREMQRVMQAFVPDYRASVDVDAGVVGSLVACMARADPARSGVEATHDVGAGREARQAGERNARIDVHANAPVSCVSCTQRVSERASVSEREQSGCVFLRAPFWHGPQTRPEALPGAGAGRSAQDRLQEEVESVRVSEEKRSRGHECGTAVNLKGEQGATSQALMSVQTLFRRVVPDGQLHLLSGVRNTKEKTKKQAHKHTHTHTHTHTHA